MTAVFFVLLACSAVSLGVGIGLTVNHFLVSRPLMQRIIHMRYVGFMGDATPDWEPEPQTPRVRED